MINYQERIRFMSVAMRWKISQFGDFLSNLTCEIRFRAGRRCQRKINQGSQAFPWTCLYCFNEDFFACIFLGNLCQHDQRHYCHHHRHHILIILVLLLIIIIITIIITNTTTTTTTTIIITITTIIIITLLVVIIRWISTGLQRTLFTFPCS